MNRNLKFRTPLNFILALFGLGLLTACSTPEKPVDNGENNQRLATNFVDDCRALFSAARRMDSVLLGELSVNDATAAQAIKAFADFANYCRSDTMAPVFLIKTAQVARAVDNLPQAKLALESCIDRYPGFRNRDAAIFLLAQLYGEPTHLNNNDEARRLYQKIIDEYPHSDWVASARGAIRFLGRTDAEILNELKKKQ